MPDMQDRSDSEFARYDAMSTEELQQLLREDASKPSGEESDTHVLLYVMEVLAKQRKERNEGKSPEEALESFKQNYSSDNPETKISSTSESVPTARKRRSIGRWMQGLIAAAAMLVVIVGGSITAHAMGVDIWEIIAKWTQETFHFGYVGQVEEDPSSDYIYPCASLQEALDKNNVTTALVPTWMPSGYSEDGVDVSLTPKHRAYKASYKNGKNYIAIRIAEYLDSEPMQIEKSDDLIEIYTSNGVDYYIFQNYDQLDAVWNNGHFECLITGSLTVSEVEEMIDSIEEG